MTDSERNESPFTDQQKALFGALVEMIVPASDEFGVPGASDTAILGEILDAAAPHYDALSEALRALDDLGNELEECHFTDLGETQKESVVEVFREQHPLVEALLTVLTFQCYYRDDRVLASLGMEARPPHPLGYEVVQGDWSLLDPVKKKAKLWRDA